MKRPVTLHSCLQLLVLLRENRDEPFRVVTGHGPLDEPRKDNGQCVKTVPELAGS